MAQKQQFGSCLERVLQQRGYVVTIVESHDVSRELTRQKFDLLIVTNTSISPAQIQRMVPEMKARYPDTRIIVLSGYCPDDFVTDLKQKGIDGFLLLPFKEDVLLKKVAALLPIPTL